MKLVKDGDDYRLDVGDVSVWLFVRGNKARERLNDVIKDQEHGLTGVSSPLDGRAGPVVQSMIDDLDELHAWGRMAEPMPQTTLAKMLVMLSDTIEKYRTDDMVGG